MGASTEFFFGCTRFLVGLGLDIVSWSFTFSFVHTLAQPVADIANRYQNNIAAPLESFVLFLAAAYAAFHIFRGRLAKGAGEFGVSVLIVGLAGAFLLNRPADFLNTSINQTGALSGAVVSLALNCGDSCNTHQFKSCPPPFRAEDCGDDTFNQYRGLVHPLERGIHRAFIDSPYDLIQWGDMLDGNPSANPTCVQRRNQILAKSGRQPRRHRGHHERRRQRPRGQGLHRPVQLRPQAVEVDVGRPAVEPRPGPVRRAVDLQPRAGRWSASAWRSCRCSRP